MIRPVLLVCIVVAVLCDAATAQRRLPRRPGGRSGGGVQIQRDGDSTNRRNDVEGTIWEFKVLDSSESNRSKQTKMTGRIRIKQTSVFAVGKVEVKEQLDSKDSGDATQVMREFDRNGDQQLNTSELDALLASMRSGNRSGQAGDSGPAGNREGGHVQGELKGLLSQRINSAKQQDTGGERIGDLTKDRSSEKTFRFDEDDEYPLSGMVVVTPDTKKSNGTWLGRYDEFVDGRKENRWRFEMRKIEE